MEFDFLFYSLLTQFFEFFWSYIFDENFNTEKVETFRQWLPSDFHSAQGRDKDSRKHQKWRTLQQTLTAFSGYYWEALHLR